MVGCCSETRGWDPQERAAILSATGGDTTCSKVSGQLRLQWNDADLSQQDRHGKSRNQDGNRKSHDRRMGNAHIVDLSDGGRRGIDPHEQPSELPGGAFGGDGVYCAGEPRDQYEESFERDEDDVLAAVSQTNRTLTQARQAVKDARATRTTSAQEVNSCVSE